MTPRCKPGDLAVCEYGPQSVRGVIVTIKRALGEHEMFANEPGAVHWEAAPEMPHPKAPGCFIAWPDAWMRPLRGKPVADDLAADAKKGEVAHA